MATEGKPRFRPSYKTCTQVTASCPVAATTYGYYPVLGGNLFYTVWFGILFLGSLFLGVKSKAWTYTVALGLGTALEALGYVGRILMHQNPWDSGGFKMQICCLVLAPSFLAACIYLTLKHLVLFFGPEHSIIRPRLYPWIFVGCDLGSMVLQGIGGGVAASASTKPQLLDVGNGLIIAGIAFQVATMSVCGLLVLLFIWKYQKAKKGSVAVATEAEKSQYHSISTDPKERKKLMMFCSAVALAYLAILIRCIYRLPEMAGGWGNALMRNEKEFLILDGGMIALACFLLTAFHPAFFFKAMCRNKQF